MSKTVLLVEDYADTRELMRIMLEMLGHNVIEAADGRQAVELAKEDGFDLILMDIAMPVMDGITATRQIKQIDRAAHIPIIVVTAHSKEYQAEALKAGALKVMKKPVDINDLQPLLTQYLIA